MTAGTRRNGSSKLGPFNRAAADHPARPGQGAPDGYGALLARNAPLARSAPLGRSALIGGPALAGAGALNPRGPWSGRSLDYTGRHVIQRSRPGHGRVGKAVPAAAVAATLAAGAAAYTLSGFAHSQLSGQSASAVISGTVSGTDSTSAARAAAARAAAARASAASASEAAAVPAVMSVATATVPEAKHAYVPRHAKPAAKVATAATHSVAAAPSAPAAQSAAPAAAPATSAPSHAAASTVSCQASSGLIPQNATAIVSFLLAHGYSDNAAAGIAGNIYQESGGDQEETDPGDGGLISWTPLPAGYITGDLEADLQTQLDGILAYNNEWSSYLPALNSADSPSDAADIYSEDFERPGIPDLGNRETSAEDVASACGI